MQIEPLELNGIAGAAFLLRTPGRKSVTLQHKEGVVVVRQGAPYVTVQLSSSHPDDALRDETWRVLQEALDIHAVTHRKPIGTSRGENEYLLWTRKESAYELTFANTMEVPWDVSGRLTGGPPRSTPVKRDVPHHPSFRFYRLSQLTDDLFDAYRNAYLSLECLVSDESPKQSQEAERDWLKRVLGGPLSAGVPKAMDISMTVDDLYELGRLPLFHAKTQRSYYAPQGSKRECVQELLGRINALLASLFRYKFGECLPAGWPWLSDVVKDGMMRATFQFDEVVYRRGCECASCHARVQVMDQRRRFGNLWARLEAAPPARIGYIDAVEFCYGGQKRMTMSFPEPVPMAGLAIARFEISAVIYAVRAPRPSYGS
jgi:hypothetical protein